MKHQCCQCDPTHFCVKCEPACCVDSAGTVRLYVILDTSVLLTHWSFIQALQRNLGKGGMVAAEQEGGESGDPPSAPGVQMVLVVPWAVLVELDKLKEQRPVLRIKGAVLCCAVLCCAVLCCAVLCCAVLCCAVLCCAVLCCAVLCCAVLCCAVLCCAVLCCAVTILHDTPCYGSST